MFQHRLVRSVARTRTSSSTKICSSLTVVVVFMQIVGCHSRSRITRPVIAKPAERLHRFQGHKLYTHEFILEKACRRKLCAELAKRQLHSYGCISVVIDLGLLTVRARCEQTDLLNNILLLPSFASGQRVPSLSVNPMPHVSDRASNKQVFLQSVLTSKLAWLLSIWGMIYSTKVDCIRSRTWT
jgi:hypothetical protein